MNIDNFDWGVMNNDPLLKSILTREIFEKNIYTSLYDIKEGDVVVDVGASIGPFVYSILDKKPSHIYAIEPSKKEFPTLVKNTRNHPVCQINKAIWDGDGITNAIDTYFWDGYVETMRFKTFLELYSIEKIDFLKTDCEGGEYFIFNEENIDFLVNNVEIIVGEWHLESPEMKERFRKFRDLYLPRFKNFSVYSVDGVDIKGNLYSDRFISYYKQIVIHIDNRKL